ncbi:hypothetical protein CDAR_508011 [Caerostris darwini]|uniref:Uncharacterized protein n=1 Tax=Caerostris darwini TaxID=1538125 RepID=A0AAV4USR5_9ARAC|nr:hypothetical protein CDAR_508011 [Caerostris darwini]
MFYTKLASSTFYRYKPKPPPTLGRSKVSNSFLHHVKNILEIPSALLPLPIPNKQVPSCLGNYGLTRHPPLQNKCKGSVDLWLGRVFWRRLALDHNHLLSKPSICPVSSIFSTILLPLHPRAQQSIPTEILKIIYYSTRRRRSNLGWLGLDRVCLPSPMTWFAECLKLHLVSSFAFTSGKDTDERNTGLG